MAKGSNGSPIVAAKQNVAVKVKDVIWHPEWNTRQIAPREGNHEVKDLGGATLPDSLLGQKIVPYVIRRTQNEDSEKWGQVYPGKPLPPYVGVDGFTSIQDQFNALGNEFWEHTIECIYIEPTHPAMAGLEASMVSIALNNCRHDTHPIDMARVIQQFIDAHLDKDGKPKLSATDIARKLGWSNAKMSNVMACNKLSDEQRQKAIRENWPLAKILKVVKPKKDEPKKTSDVRPRLTRPLLDEAIKRTNDLATEGYTSDAKGNVWLAFAAGLEYARGDYGPVSIDQAVIASGLQDILGDKEIARATPPEDEEIEEVEEVEEVEAPAKAKKTASKKTGSAKKTDSASKATKAGGSKTKKAGGRKGKQHVHSPPRK